MSMQRRCLTLSRGRHQYVFRYYQGQEARLLGTFLELAERPRCSFDFADAAVLAYQMGKKIEDTRGFRVEISPQSPREQVGNRLA